MLGDAVAAKKSTGQAKENLEVIDVAQLLAAPSRRTGPRPTTPRRWTPHPEQRPAPLPHALVSTR